MGIGKITVESMVNSTFWSGKRVLLTGHTGFKGSWLSYWLLEMGAEVFGYALEPETVPSLFDQLRLGEDVHHQIGDIRDSVSVEKRVNEADPDVVIHMAAQPLVLRSYKEPAYTWETNVMGTIHLMQALRNVKKKTAVVIVTTDKVYENRELNYSYKEDDRLGGFDPYSSSKASAEIAVSSWRNSYFGSEHPVRIATGRAGNVIGGGDWAEHRIVPDIIRALSKKEMISVRSPQAVRPWQHVLEPLSGYLRLSEFLYEKEDSKFQSAFNFGPLQGNSQTVKELVESSLRVWPGDWSDDSDEQAPHEAGLLQVSIDKAHSILHWSPKWDFEQSVKETVEWYRDQISGKDPVKLTSEQIKRYSQH